MKKYIVPEIEVSGFDVADIITLSSGTPGLKISDAPASVAGYESANGFNTGSNGYTHGE